jgi:hypothetical protein
VIMWLRSATDGARRQKVRQSSCPLGGRTVISCVRYSYPGEGIATVRDAADAYHVGCVEELRRPQHVPDAKGRCRGDGSGVMTLQSAMSFTLAAAPHPLAERCASFPGFHRQAAQREPGCEMLL